jgi:hypothetical protein
MTLGLPLANIAGDHDVPEDTSSVESEKPSPGTAQVEGYEPRY